MDEVTRILLAVESGEPKAFQELLTVVFDELRLIARAKFRHERPDHTLQATALVNEAYLRLIGNKNEFNWKSRAHFFAAAAEAMRRILIESARQKKSQKRGGEFARIQLDSVEHPATRDTDKLIALNDAIDRLAEQDPVKASLVKLRFFAGLSNEQAANSLDISTATADRYWAYCRAWLKVELSD
jgi:RNA polymerase sigma factor (TIGR02999 family)